MQEWESIACVTATNYAWSARLGWYVAVPHARPAMLGVA